MEKFTETHNEAKRWLRRYHKNDIKDGIYAHGIVVVFFRLRWLSPRYGEVYWKRDVTSLQARNSSGIYDLRLCLRVTRHCKIDGDGNGPFVILR